MLLKLLLLLIIRKFVLVLFPCSCWLFRFRFCVQFFCFGFLVFFWCALFCVCFWGVKARLRSLFLMHRFRWCGRFFYLCRWLFFDWNRAFSLDVRRTNSEATPICFCALLVGRCFEPLYVVLLPASSWAVEAAAVFRFYCVRSFFLCNLRTHSQIRQSGARLWKFGRIWPSSYFVLANSARLVARILCY